MPLNIKFSVVSGSLTGLSAVPSLVEGRGQPLKALKGRETFENFEILGTPRISGKMCTR